MELEFCGILFMGTFTKVTCWTSEFLSVAKISAKFDVLTPGASVRTIYTCNSQHTITTLCLWSLKKLYERVF